MWVGILLLAFLLGPPLTGAAATQQPSGDLPTGFEQILPKGRIAAIRNPVFVSAEAAEIADETWVFGVVIDGQARAYSLNLLNHHEVVNDQVRDHSFAAVW